MNRHLEQMVDSLVGDPPEANSVERVVDQLVGGIPESLQILYHVAFEKNVPAIRSRGISPQKKGTWVGGTGRDLRKEGMIYAFTSFDDAARWAFKQEWEIKEPTVVVRFRDDRDMWEKDTHWQAGLAKGAWLRKRGSVPASAIIDAVKVTPTMARSLAQTAGEPEEVEPPSIERVITRLMAAAEPEGDDTRQDTEADQMVARYKAQPVSIWTFTDLPVEERMAWAYLAADEFMGADFQGDTVAQFVSALNRVTAKPDDFWEQIREKDPVREEYLRRLDWSIRVVPLKDTGVYPRFSGYPKEWSKDSVIETAKLVINSKNHSAKRHRILSLAATYQTVLKFLPPILVPTGTLRKDADFTLMAWEIDDGNHRAVAAAIGGATHMVVFAGSKKERVQSA